MASTQAIFSLLKKQLLPESLTATAVSFTEDPFEELKEQLEEPEAPEPQYEPVSDEEKPASSQSAAGETP